MGKDRRTSLRRWFLSRAFKNGKHLEMQKAEDRISKWWNMTQVTATQELGAPSKKPTAVLSIKFRLPSHRVEARRLSPGNQLAKVSYIHTLKYFARTFHSFGRKWHFLSHDITETGFHSVGFSYQKQIRGNLQQVRPVCKS